jgi:hypothetical protein
MPRGSLDIASETSRIASLKLTRLRRISRRTTTGKPLGTSGSYQRDAHASNRFVRPA